MVFSVKLIILNVSRPTNKAERTELEILFFFKKLFIYFNFALYEVLCLTYNNKY